MYICVHSDLMSKGPSEREGQIEIKTQSRNKNRSRDRREPIAEADTDLSLFFHYYFIFCVSDQPFQYFIVIRCIRFSPEYRINQED
jgi:hypothetical protein